MRLESQNVENLCLFGTRLLINIVILGKTWYVLAVLYILQLITNIDHRLQLPTRKRYTRPIQWIASRLTTTL